MRVDAVGRARDQCCVILVRVEVQVAHFVRQHGAYLIHLVRVRVVKYVERKRVAFFEAVEAGEQFRRRQSGVPGDGGVRACATDRQR